MQELFYFTYMQSAVDIVQTSAHPANKIAAVLAGEDVAGQPFSLAKVNFWPAPIREKIGLGVEIGNASGTVHAETACLLAAPRTRGATLFVTDPPCPNCVKNMAEAGIKKLYIDHKGFGKDFARRRGDDFEEMSLMICKKSGISVHVVHRREQRIETILEIADDYWPAIEKPARVFEVSKAIDEPEFKKIVRNEKEFYEEKPFAIALAHPPHLHLPPVGGGEEGRRGNSTQSFLISAEIHAIAGFTSDMPAPEGKYNYQLQPVHRVLMTAARRGLRIDHNYLFCSRVPTAREQVNLVGAGFSKLYLGDDRHARDEDGLRAFEQLVKAGILCFMDCS